MRENNNKKQILLAGGIAGCGKGFVGELGEELGIRHISSGEFMRGDETCPREVLAAGSLKEGERALRLVTAKLYQIGEDNDFVIEGYPRTQEQCGHIVALIKKTGHEFAVLKVSALPDEAERRILADPKRDTRDDNGVIRDRHKRDMRHWAQMERFWLNLGVRIYVINNNKPKGNVRLQFKTVLETERLLIAAGVPSMWEMDRSAAA